MGRTASTASVRASAPRCIHLESVNVLMCAAVMLLARRAVVSLFIDAPTEEIISYAGGYLTVVAPFYVVLGLLIVYRSAVQSMGNSAPRRFSPASLSW